MLDLLECGSFRELKRSLGFHANERNCVALFFSGVKKAIALIREMLLRGLVLRTSLCASYENIF